MHQLDLDGDGVLTGTGELDEVNPLGGMSPHFNKANELIARDLDGDGSDDDTQTFDAVGNLTDDGRDYKYIYDAFGRLVEVTDQSDNTVAAYGYNGLNHRISWHYDVTGSGGGPVPDGSVDGDDPTFYFVYNERWQHVATYRGSDANPKEQFLYHTAGVAGSGSSSYVDAMLLRDDHDADWDAAADSTLERRVYYVQNWRWDVVALLADNGRVLERAWHEPYGTPHGLPAADLTTSNNSGNDDFGVPDGDADASDQGYFNTLHAASSTRADLTGSATSTDFDYGRPDGTVDADDDSYYTDIKNAADTLGRGALSAEDGLRNRRGLSGYEWDPTHGKYHVRYRILRPETGRWTTRDPIRWKGGRNMYLYGPLSAIADTDPLGLFQTSPRHIRPTRTLPRRRIPHRWPPTRRDTDPLTNPYWPMGDPDYDPAIPTWDYDTPVIYDPNGPWKPWTPPPPRTPAIWPAELPDDLLITPAPAYTPELAPPFLDPDFIGPRRPTDDWEREYPGQSCPNWKRKQLNDWMKKACNGASGCTKSRGRCANLGCDEIARRWAQKLECAARRAYIIQECFAGRATDDGHWRQLKQALAGAQDCASCFHAKQCPSKVLDGVLPNWQDPIITQPPSGPPAPPPGGGGGGIGVH